MTSPTAVARDARPPRAVVAVLHPILCRLLRGRRGRRLDGLALPDFEGRRTGRRHLVPVGWYPQGPDRAIVVTPAAWRANFRGEHRAIVWEHGTRRSMIGPPTVVAG